MSARLGQPAEQRMRMAKEETRGLAELEVAITGKLASMTRAQAIERIVSAGGAYVASPGEHTHLLVVGQGGPPLGADGLLTKSLVRARELQARADTQREPSRVPSRVPLCVPLCVIGEDEFLSRLGDEGAREGLHRLYTTQQLGRVLEVETRTIRAWIRNGLIKPVKVVHRLCFFDFRQVAYAKRLSQLSRAGISAGRLRKSLEDLGSWLPDSHEALGQLEAIERRGPLVLRTDDGQLAETSGQLRLDFEHGTTPIAALADVARFADGTSVCERPDETAILAEDWFRQGVTAEEDGRLEDAAAAYARALRIRPEPEVLFNLGNTLYSLRRREEAVDRYREATAADPFYVEAWNNLGIVLSEIKQHDEALRAFQRALAIEPGYADAHYNLAETWALLGDMQAARKHWRAYLAHDPNSPWADKVRAKLHANE